MNSPIYELAVAALNSNLVGSVIGGSLALVGAWLGVRWQSGVSARGLAAALLAEIEAQMALDPNGVGEAFVRGLLEDIRQTGEILDGELLEQMLDHRIEAYAPVYAGSVTNLGHLPRLLASRIAHHYAAQEGLLHSARTLVKTRDVLDDEQRQPIAYGLLLQYDSWVGRRAELVAELAAFVAPRSLLERLIGLESRSTFEIRKPPA